MYITITRQHLGNHFSQSAGDYVAYLEKENKDRSPEDREQFFDQNNDQVSPERVVEEIDQNTAKLKKKEPKFYALTINPSQRELRHIGNDPQMLRQYVREVMKDYAAAFHRDREVTVTDIKYFAKIEHERRFKGFDRQVKENQPYRARMAKLNNDLRKLERGEITGSAKAIKGEVEQLIRDAPHKIDGVPIKQGMRKPGLQTHIHIIVSRKDAENKLSLSPGSRYIESEASLNGQTVKRGFNRNQFYEQAEKRFDAVFQYNRNFVETYQARKEFNTNPYGYFAKLMGLPTNERSAAFKILGKAGVHIPKLGIPKTKVDLALKTIKEMKKAVQLARTASNIEI